MCAKIPGYVRTETLVLSKTTLCRHFYVTIGAHFMRMGFQKVQRGDERAGEVRRDETRRGRRGTARPRPQGNYSLN